MMSLGAVKMLVHSIISFSLLGIRVHTTLHQNILNRIAKEKDNVIFLIFRI